MQYLEWFEIQAPLTGKQERNSGKPRAAKINEPFLDPHPRH